MLPVKEPVGCGPPEECRLCGRTVIPDPDMTRRLSRKWFAAIGVAAGAAIVEFVENPVVVAAFLALIDHIT